jgi:hypothetical protein
VTRKARVIPIAASGGGRPPPADDGWRRVSTLSEPRLTEMADNYRALGYEVEIRDLQKTDADCSTCFDADDRLGRTYGTLYVRQRGTGPQDDGLFD